MSQRECYLDKALVCGLRSEVSNKEIYCYRRTSHCMHEKAMSSIEADCKRSHCQSLQRKQTTYQQPRKPTMRSHGARLMRQKDMPMKTTARNRSGATRIPDPGILLEVASYSQLNLILNFNSP